VSRAAAERSAVVSGPIAGAPFLGRPLSYDLAALGYSTEEFFLEGTARSYAPTPGEARYRTRVVVRRPLDPARFDGSVVVEWFRGGRARDPGAGRGDARVNSDRTREV
jgi:hypothetical protein